jgi:two-component system cell cycle sensor histidine kinase/response regulator CckA
VESGDFSGLIEANPDGVAVLADGRYLYVNASWASALGTTASALLGRALLDDVYKDDQLRVIKALGPGGSGVTEAAFVGASGGRVFLELSPFRIPTFDGRPAQGVIGRDVTGLKRSSAQLLLADRMMSIGALAAGVAHEINNPLSYVLGNLGFLVEELGTMAADDPSREDVVEAVKEAYEGAERVRRIVRDLQAFSRADQEKKAPINLNRTIESAINMAWIEIRHRARLVKELGEVVPVSANEARLGQVILNLLLYSAHSMPEGKADQHHIKIKTASEGNFSVVEVTDNGPGVSAEILSGFFDAMPHRPGGTSGSLGLSIAHSIVVDLGGSITATSELGKGTSFRVLLPGLVDDASAASGPPSIKSPGANRMRILIIDDEPLIAAALKRALKGHDLEVMDSGRKAVDILATGASFDLIFCDLMMPELTGMDVYEWVKADRPGLESHIVFMTGGTFTPRAQAFLESVPNPRLEKPFDVEKVRRLIDRASGASTER